MSPGRSVLSVSRTAQPRPAAPPCAPTRPARGMSGFWTRQVYIGFPLFVLPEIHPGGHSSIVWRVRGAVSPGRTVPSASCAARPRPAPSSRRALPRADPPGGCTGFGIDKWRDVKKTCLRCYGRNGGRLSPGRNVLSASRATLPRPAAPPCAPTPPARGMSGFWARQTGFVNSEYVLCLHDEKD